MGRLEQMLIDNDNIKIKETDVLPSELSGVTLDRMILLNMHNQYIHKVEVLYEELAHHKLTYGDITDQSQFNNRKFEGYARRQSYEWALPFQLIIDAYISGVSNLYELADYAQLSEPYIEKVLGFYKQKYGISTQYGKYLITFEPLRVFEYKDVY
jgi:hypothetical protein